MQSALIALWATRQHTASLCYGHPEFESPSRAFPDTAPLSPTSLPVSSDLSYHKGKNAKNKFKKRTRHAINMSD